MSGPFDAIRQFYDHNVRPVQDRVVDVVEDVAEAGGVVRDAVVDGAVEVREAVAERGVVNVGVDLFTQHAIDMGEGTGVLVKALASGSPQDFVKWISGAQGPSFADYTAQVPGLQSAIGHVMDKSMENPLIAGAAGRLLSFQYNADNDFYTTNAHGLQSYLGFHTLYDRVGGLLGMDLDDKVVQVEVGGVEYKLELWKGSYGSGGAYGGEIGLYTRNTDQRGPLGNLLEHIPGYYTSANNGDQIRMTQTIYDKTAPAGFPGSAEKPLFTNAAEGSDKPGGEHFWNLAIRTDPGVEPGDLGQKGTLEFKDPAVATAICAELNAQGVPAQVGADGKTVDYTWE